MVDNLAEAQNHPVEKDAFLKLDASIRESKRALDDASMSVARDKKAAKKAGVNQTAYAMMEKIRKLDEDERPIIVRALVQYCTWLDLPLGTQMSLMDAPQTPKPKPPGKVKPVVEEDGIRNASLTGQQAGREGDDASSNPYDANTPHATAWSKGHMVGLGERATAARMLGDEVHSVHAEPKVRRARKADQSASNGLTAH